MSAAPTAAARTSRRSYGKTLKGRFLGVVLGTVGKRVLAKAFTGSVKAVEERSRAADAELAPNERYVPTGS